MRLPELLAPAGSMEKLEVALHYGADAVYMGGTDFGLRNMTGNFTLAEMAEAIRRSHDAGARIYLTVNAYLHNHDLSPLDRYLDQVLALPFDAYIVSDPGVIQSIRDRSTDAVLHLSTQANTTNWRSAAFWQQFGIRRVNLARESSIDDIRETRARTDMELEVFIHGALCMAYSGRCLISSLLTGRNANKGECTHPCRWNYALVEESRPGQYFPVEETGRGTLIFNSRDLCLLDHLPLLIEAGVDSLKIEGRMKGVHYLGTTVRIYRLALDRFAESGAEGFRSDPSWQAELDAVSRRGYTPGFLFGPPDADAQTHTPCPVSSDFAGIVREVYKDGSALMEVRGPITAGDELEIISNGPTPLRFVPEQLQTADGVIIERANPNTRLLLHPPAPLNRLDLVRRRFISISE